MASIVRKPIKGRVYLVKQQSYRDPKTKKVRTRHLGILGVLFSTGVSYGFAVSRELQNRPHKLEEDPEVAVAKERLALAARQKEDLAKARYRSKIFAERDKRQVWEKAVREEKAAAKTGDAASTEQSSDQ